jgi:hypothetical protein
VRTGHYRRTLTKAIQPIATLRLIFSLWQNLNKSERINMKKELILLSSVIAVMLLFISSTVHAESWVLWQKKEYIKTNMEQNIFWEIIDAYPEHKQCLQGMTRIWKVIKNQAIEDKKKYDTISEIKEVPYSLIITNFKEPKEIMSISENFYCLPGTLDPRERK